MPIHSAQCVYALQCIGLGLSRHRLIMLKNGSLIYVNLNRSQSLFRNEIYFYFIYFYSLK